MVGDAPHGKKHSMLILRVLQLQTQNNTMTQVLLLFYIALFFSQTQENTINELFSLMGNQPEKTVHIRLSDFPPNQTGVGVKDPSLLINELLEQSKKVTGPKIIQPLPAGVWPKHTDLVLVPHPGPHNKSKKGSKGDRLPTEHNSEKNGSDGRMNAPVLPPKVMPATNQTSKITPDSSVKDDKPTPSDSDIYHNSRSHGRLQPNSTMRWRVRETPNKRMDPEENRPGKSSITRGNSGNSTHPSVLYNRHSSSMPYHFDIHKKESDFTHDAMCLSECRKERDEKEYFCYSEFAINGIVYDIEIIRRGIRLLTLLVNSDGFYKMSRLYVTPDSYFFKVNMLVLDTFKCTKPCPEFKLGSRYIIMGQIYQRRRHLPGELLVLVGGKLKPGDGLLRSNNYVKRYNRRRHQKTQEATQSKCR